jgi:cell division protein FtsB
MRWAIVSLIVLTLFLQWPLWWGDGSWSDVRDMRESVRKQRDENRALEERNNALEAEVEDLRLGTEAVEERARRDLGMIMEGEIFFLLVPPQVDMPGTSDVKLNSTGR